MDSKKLKYACQNKTVNVSSERNLEHGPEYDKSWSNMSLISGVISLTLTLYSHKLSLL